ncbi:hypothetical protein SMICM17S_00631 [Streptomyces microflavus]
MPIGDCPSESRMLSTRVAKCSAIPATASAEKASGWYFQFTRNPSPGATSTVRSYSPSWYSPSTSSKSVSPVVRARSPRYPERAESW